MKEDLKIPVHSTKDYGKFSFVQANREINEKHVESLVQSIKRKNLLSICPVIVSEDMEVIDGQHRIEAAKILDEEIFYITSKGLDIDDILSLNNVRKPWGLMDYFNFYYTQKISGFKEVNALMVKTGWSLNQICSVVSKSGTMQTLKIKSGEMDISNIGNAEKIISAVKDFDCAAPNSENNLFIRGLRWLISNDGNLLKIVKNYRHEIVKEFLDGHKDFSMKKYFSNTSIKRQRNVLNYKGEIYGDHVSYYAISYIYLDIYSGKLK